MRIYTPFVRRFPRLSLKLTKIRRINVMALKYIHIFFQATVSNNPSNDEELPFDASCLAEKSFWHRICRSFESTLSLSDFRSSRINPHSSNQSTVKKNKIIHLTIIFLFFLLRIISRMIGIFEEKFVFIIVGIPLFLLFYQSNRSLNFSFQ